MIGKTNVLAVAKQYNVTFTSPSAFTTCSYTIKDSNNTILASGTSWATSMTFALSKGGPYTLSITAYGLTTTYTFTVTADATIDLSSYCYCQVTVNSSMALTTSKVNGYTMPSISGFYVPKSSSSATYSGSISAKYSGLSTEDLATVSDTAFIPSTSAVTVSPIIVGKTVLITNSGTLNIPLAGTYKILAIGGGGGSCYGTTYSNYVELQTLAYGGGGGGYVSVDNKQLSATGYQITVGAGGVKATNTNNNRAISGNSGGATSFGSLLSASGGGGADSVDSNFGRNYGGGNGGSGGGAGSTVGAGAYGSDGGNASFGGGGGAGGNACYISDSTSGLEEFNGYDYKYNPYMGAAGRKGSYGGNGGGGEYSIKYGGSSSLQITSSSSSAGADGTDCGTLGLFDTAYSYDGGSGKPSRSLTVPADNPGCLTGSGGGGGGGCGAKGGNGGNGSSLLVSNISVEIYTAYIGGGGGGGGGGVAGGNGGNGGDAFSTNNRNGGHGLGYGSGGGGYVGLRYTNGSASPSGRYYPYYCGGGGGGGGGLYNYNVGYTGTNICNGAPGAILIRWIA